MNLQQFIQNNTGKPVTYDHLLENYGQCEQLVCLYWQQVYGFLCPSIPLAKDLWANPVVLKYFSQIAIGSERPGDVGVWGASNLINSPQAGHTDIVISSGFLGFDSNWGNDNNANGQPLAHQVQHTYEDVLGFLRWKEEDMTATTQQLQVIYYMAVPNQPVNMNWVNAWTGHDINDAINALRDDPSRQSYITALIDDAAAYNSGTTNATVLASGLYKVT